eukprot:GHVS01036747.1.p1 GENE.GHVS01036747.1~~GHVS01036747.1.p1  ORF type:complete len:142 (+),score=8.11 GHVS01036747.1:69-494(+)
MAASTSMKSTFESLKRDLVSRSIAQKKQHVYERNLKRFQDEQFLGAFQRSKKAKQPSPVQRKGKKKGISKTANGREKATVQSKRNKGKKSLGTFALSDGLGTATNHSQSGQKRESLELGTETATILHQICAQVLRHKVTSS